MLVDLRSDTITKPTGEMLEAMISAKVGDDVFGEDPTTAALEEKAAGMLGFEAGLFCPSGTMANQVAIRTLTRPQDEVICDKRSHIYLYEAGGIASNSMVSVTLLDGDRGRITADEVASNIKPDDIHFPRTSLVALENTVNKGGGSYYRYEQIKAIRQVCNQHHIRMHLDGARLFNALIETGENPMEIGQYFDTASVCLSKGLGAPVGSVLLGSHTIIRQANRIRKVFGGGMRQSGYLAAAGIYALDHHIQRLKEDHRRAKEIADLFMSLDQIEYIHPTDTNIVICRLCADVRPETFLSDLKRNGILALGFGGQSIRMVTHLGIDDKKLEYLKNALKSMK